MSDQDVRALLARAAELAPDRLDRPDPVSRAGRRRAGLVAAGVAAAAVAGTAAAALLLSPDPGTQRLDQAAGPVAPTPQDSDAQGAVFRYHVGYDTAPVDEAVAELRPCFAAAGGAGETLFSSPPQHVGTITGAARAEAFARCVRSVDGVTLRLDQTGGPTDVARAAFRPGRAVGMEALATGVLRGDAASGCLWLEGAAGGDTPVIVHDDTAYADFSVDPPQIRAGDVVVATLGERVRVGGGHVSPELAGGAVPGCPVTAPHVFFTGGAFTPTPPDPSPPPGRGDAAVWTVDAARPPADRDLTVSALVTRVGCASGETGEVLRPRVVEDVDQVVITFTVAPLDREGGRCPGNQPVPYTVQLATPLAGRALVDGSCRSAAVASTSHCRDGGTRRP